MNQLQVILQRLNIVVDKAARKHGYTSGTMTPERDGSVFIFLWNNHDIVMSGTSKGTPKAIKEKVMSLSVQEYKNSQS